MRQQIGSNNKRGEKQKKLQVIYKSSRFDHVLPKSVSQEQVFKSCEIDQLVQSVIEGYHGTAFAYDQKGSGKSYTIEGQRDEGITIHSLFNKIKQNSLKRNFSVHCSSLQIYDEKIFDLLGEITKASYNIQPKSLKIRWSVRGQFVVENLFVYQCKSTKQVIQLFKINQEIIKFIKENFSNFNQKNLIGKQEYKAHQIIPFSLLFISAAILLMLSLSFL